MTTPKVKIVEVGPRDGLQNEAAMVATATKLELVERLVEVGLQNIELTSFVSPKWVPQMGDHLQVMQGLKPHPGVAYCVLTPNLKGFEAAVQSGAKEVAVFAAASESFSTKNINCTIAESLERFAPVMLSAQSLGLKVRGYVSCVVGCPYEGKVQPERVADVAEQLFNMGCYEISLGDTIGIGTPLDIEKMLEAVAKRMPVTALAGHFHDTYGRALMNIYTSYQFGVRVFDGSVGGLGGCPYAAGASGNGAIEDIVFLMDSLGVETGVDLEKLVDVSAWISGVLQRSPNSKLTASRWAQRATEGLLA